MGIALLALSDLFTPLQSLAHRWMPAAGRRRRRRAVPVELEADLRYVRVRPSPAGAAGAPAERTGRCAVLPSRPLRVVRVAEAGAPRPGGRVLLSGRLEDVCAELDRLAALEAAQAPKRQARPLH
ncbi:hypothetical protein [Xenophilus sp. Marseille-Q4582]|uniref:hypothetical protein n=1 Tax=Xenophilus sp. Marseille-Q4582 TaxID=2866600 RepID=UPI001CE3E3FB|nr:hypothetical protein [Xenophilus sp. Marseille-Q4582]